MAENESQPSGLTAQEAKAEAKAAKAKAKALRPWYQKKRFIVPIAIVVLGAASSALNGGGDESSSTSPAPSTSEVEESSAPDSATEEAQDSVTEEAQESESDVAGGIGDAVSEGNFSFVVNSVECGITYVGSDLLGEEAQGQFCKVAISVENTGNEAEYFSAGSQLVYDDQGREFEADTGAMIYLDEGDDVWIGSDINPGNAIDASLLFDLPEGVEPVQIRLVEGYFGVGVDVSLK